VKIIKYIINDNNIPVLFSADLTHNEVLQKVKSAGFMIINYNKEEGQFTATCFGESTSLKVTSHAATDKKIIEDFFNK
jgi:hypothetical protein